MATPFEDLRGVRVDAQVSLADIFPTVFALAGIESHARVHGRSLLPLMYRRPDQQVYAYGESMAPNLQYGWSPLHCLRSSRYKFISAPRPELYDLTTDPEETTNIADREQGVAREMSRELEHLIDETSHGAPAPEAANLDRDTVERLRSLGYVGAEAAPRKEAAADAAALADPKDKLSVFAAVQRAGELMVKDDYGEAVRALESALRDEPGMHQARLMLGSCYSELGRTRDAKAQFDTVLKDDPQSVSALTGLASILLKEGKTEDVVTLCKRTLSLDDRNPQAYTLLGDVYIARHEPSKALPYLEKAVEIQPKLSQNRLNLGACLVEVKQLTRAPGDARTDRPRASPVSGGPVQSRRALRRTRSSPGRPARLRGRNRQLPGCVQGALQSRQGPLRAGRLDGIERADARSDPHRAAATGGVPVPRPRAAARIGAAERYCCADGTGTRSGANP